MRISKFSQTPFVSHDNKNMIKISVEDWDRCNPYLSEVFLDGILVHSEKVFAPDFSFMIPCPAKDSKCCVVLTPFEDSPVKKVFDLSKPKEWKIPILYSAHEDLGYCGYVKEKLPGECYEYLKVAIKLCRKYPDFKYMIEHYWWLDSFDTYATEQEKEELRLLIKEKQIELNTPHSGVHTFLASPEQLVRSMYFSCREAKEKYDVTPKCAIYADISGFSWSALDAYVKMGIKYLSVLPNSWRNGKYETSFPPIFRWQSKSGEETALFWHQRSYRPEGLMDIWCDTLRQYPEGTFVFDHTKILKTEEWLTQRLAEIGEVAYDILPLSFYDDHEIPTTMLLKVCEVMNKKWKYPHFRMEIPSVFFREIEEKYWDKLPIFSGDIVSQMGDYHTLAPEWTAKKREATRLLYDAEMLSAIKDENNKELFRESIWNMCLFDEHCWATASKHPQNMHKANQMFTKHDSVFETSEKLSKYIKEKLGTASDRMSVTSTIPQKRYDRIKCDRNTFIPKGIKHQILPWGGVVTELLPFDGVHTRCFDGELPKNKSHEIENEIIETPFYKVFADKTSKTVESIVFKENGKELIDQNAKFELCQFIYLNSEPFDNSRYGFEVPRKLDLRIYEGDIAYVIEQNGIEEQSGAKVCSRLIFYKDDKTIDIELSFKDATGMMGDFYDRYRKNFFFAFPFKLENPQFYTESQSCEICEYTDKVKINANDCTATVNWLAAENDEYGFAIHSVDAPVFHIGDIKYNRFDKDFYAPTSHYYFYACSNRCNNLIFDSAEKCRASYRLSFVPYVGAHNDIVPFWSDRITHGLILGGGRQEKTELTVDEKNVRLVSYKGAEDETDAIVLRFTETAGRDTNATVTLPFEPKEAVYCTPDECDTASVAISDGKLCVNCKSYAYTTIKIYKK